jgi:hypothetical protein
MKRRALFIILASLGVAVSGLLALAIVGMVPFDLPLGILPVRAYSPPEAHFDSTVAQYVCQEIEAKRLVPDVLGIVDLPPKYKTITIDGTASVKHLSGGGILVYFPTTKSRSGFGAYGYLYASRALTLADRVIGSPGYIEVIDDRSRATLTPQTLPQLMQVPLSQQLNPYWWRVEDKRQAVF